MKRLDLPLLLLVLAAFLAPILGGQLLVETQPVAPGGLLAALSGGELATTPHALVALLVLAAATVGALKRRVLQVPNVTISALVLGLLGLLIASVGVSRFRFASQGVLLEWLTYGIGFFAVVAMAGRRRGPEAIIAATAAGGALAAMRALSEYAATRSPMFAGWNNPNALAGMLLAGYFCCLGLSLSLKERAILPIFGAVLTGFAVVLTQSKGGLLILVGVSVVFLVLALAWTRERGPVLARVGATFGILVLLVAGLQFSQPAAGSAEGSASSAPLGRVAAAGETQAQSFTFRKLLYRTSLDIVKDNPVGTGVGTFYYYSAQPGHVTGTVLGHNTTLQLAAEASPLAAAAFLALAGLLGYHLMRGARRMDSGINALRLGALCALLAIGAHSVIESSFSYFGLGLTAFLLAGAGLLLASDSVAPEHIPGSVRAMAAACCVLTAVGLSANAFLEVGRSGVAYAMATQDAAGVKSGLASMEWLGGGDPQYWMFQARVASSPEERLSALRRAAQLSPQPRVLRQIARVQQDLENSGEAVQALTEALRWDPNNLLALRQMMDLESGQGSQEAAAEVARRLIAVEGKTYFTVRSIAEVIPTETYAARLLLASTAKSAAETKELLAPALDGYQRYATITAPQVARFVASGAEGFAGETPDSVRQRLTEAQQVADLLEKAGQSVTDARAQFRAAEEELGKAEAALRG